MEGKHHSPYILKTHFYSHLGVLPAVLKTAAFSALCPLYTLYPKAPRWPENGMTMREVWRPPQGRGTPRRISGAGGNFPDPSPWAQQSEELPKTQGSVPKTILQTVTLSP